MKDADSYGTPVKAAKIVPDNEIARRAYALFLARRGTHGQDIDDWRATEREFRGDRESSLSRNGRQHLPVGHLPQEEDSYAKSTFEPSLSESPDSVYRCNCALKGRSPECFRYVRAL